MAGLPPYIGFISKLYVFVSIVNANNISFIAFLMVIITFSTFYYIRILKIIFFEVRTNKTNNLLFQGNFNFAKKDFYYTIMCFCLFFLVILFFFPTYLILISKYITFGFFKI
jgi:NADH:ubiquinone oxidoreductase subunit 2 (subunit N)